MSIASVAASQTSALSAAATQAAASISNTASSSSTASSTGTTASALSSLASNFNDFLSLLTTQLQNQDPTSPMDTDTFTSELVQFTSVQEQVNTNSSLTSLIQLTQDGQVTNASTIVGKQVAATSDQIPLQSGSGTVQFTGTAGEQVAIAITNSAGTDVKDAVVNATAGTNTWTWNGNDNNGNSVADGSYNIAVLGQSNGGTAAAVPFTVLGTATGVSKAGSSVDLQMGATSVDMSAVQSLVTQ